MKYYPLSLIKRVTHTGGKEETNHLLKRSGIPGNVGKNADLIWKTRHFPPLPGKASREEELIHFVSMQDDTHAPFT